MTFTNRIGQDIMIKLSSVDEPKVLRASDSRVAFVHRHSGGPDKLQVCEMLLFFVFYHISSSHVFIVLRYEILVVFLSENVKLIVGWSLPTSISGSN